jgi:hypothetical protein
LRGRGQKWLKRRGRYLTAAKAESGVMSKADEELLVAHAQDLMAEIDARMSGALPPGTTY